MPNYLINWEILLILQEKVQRKMRNSRQSRAFTPSYESPDQLTLYGFEHPFDRELDKSNRWVLLSHLIPWDEIISIYNKAVGISNTGRPGLNPRIVLGSLMIKHLCHLDDPVCGYPQAAESGNHQRHQRKDKQGNLVEQVDFLPVNAFDEEFDCGQGREETRRCSVISDLSLIESKEEWTGLKTLVKIESERYIKGSGETGKETRLYISSLQADAGLINRSVRAHWGVENSLHWVLVIYAKLFDILLTF
jgi:hypothetical protein